MPVPRPSRWPAALALVALLGATPGAARAWTDAAVRSVSARVVLAPDASAHVTLTAAVRVHGGWLEGIEIAGLDPDLALDEGSPPYAVDDAGERYEARAEVREGGRVQLTFPGRSPRRGRLTLGIAYRTSLAQRATEPLDDADRVRVRWTLPAWRSGLDGVQIEVIAPRGSEIGPRGERDSGASVETHVDAVAEGTRLRWRRAHLPRTVPWTVSVDVPANAMVEALRGAPRVRALPPPAPRSVGPADPAPYWIGLALVLALLACAKIASAEALARRSRSPARPLVPSPSWLRALTSLAASIAGGWIGPAAPRVGLALFAIAMLAATYRVAAPRRTSRLGAWRPADARWIRAARRAWLRAIAPASVFDASTPLGLAHLAAWLSVPWLLPLPLEVRLCLSVLPIPLVLTGTRASFPSSPMDTLGALLAIARDMKTLPDGVGLAPVVHVDVRGDVQDARVRTVLERRPRGLLRLDLALAQAPRAGGHVREPALLVVTRAASAAEDALASALPEHLATPSPGSRRVLRLLPLDQLAPVVAVLSTCPEAPSATRGTAAVQDTVHALPAPRAVGF